MIIIVVLSFAFSVGMVARIAKRDGYNEWFTAPLATGMAGWAGMLLGCALLVLVINRADVTTKILAFRATQQTMDAARANDKISAIELAAIQRDAIEKNGWLSAQRYWHQNQWTSWFVPGEVMRLEAIR